jgi:hypothetical protein
VNAALPATAAGSGEFGLEGTAELSDLESPRASHGGLRGSRMTKGVEDGPF